MRRDKTVTFTAAPTAKSAFDNAIIGPRPVRFKFNSISGAVFSSIPRRNR